MKVQFRTLGGKVVSEEMFGVGVGLPKIGDVVVSDGVEPKGVFIVKAVDKEQKAINLVQVDCDPCHWQGAHGRYKTSDDACGEKGCPLLDTCPFDTEAMMVADCD